MLTHQTYITLFLWLVIARKPCKILYIHYTFPLFSIKIMLLDISLPSVKVVANKETLFLIMFLRWANEREQMCSFLAVQTKEHLTGNKFSKHAILWEDWSTNMTTFRRAYRKTLFCCRSKMFLKIFRNIFCILDENFASLLHARENRETFWETLKFTDVSATMFPWLPWP